MLTWLGSILAVVTPVFICAGLGFAWARSGRAYDRGGVTGLISMIGAPCLVFRNLVGLAVDRAAMVEMLAASLLSIALFALLGLVVLRALRLPTHTFLAPLVFANAGNMGLAISRFAFPGDGAGGSAGLTLGICYFTVASLLHFTVGVVFWSGRLNAGQLVRTPLTWAVLTAMGVIGTGIELPGWLLQTTSLLGDMSIPLMLLTLGVSLAELRASGLPRSMLLASVRLGMGTSVGFAVAALLGLEGVARGVLILQCSMPSAVFNYLFAEQYERSPADVASLVVVSTLMSFVTLPVLLFFLLPGSL